MSLPTITVLDGVGVSQTRNTLPNAGQVAMAESLPVAIANDQSAIPTTNANIPAVGQKAMTGSVPVVIASDQSDLTAQGFAINPAASVTRPADTTAYASGDLVANSTTAGSVAYPAIDIARKAAGSISLARLRLRKSAVTLTNASFRVHLYRSAPTFTNGDNGAWATNGVANYLGYYDITMDSSLSDGAQGIYGFTAQPTIKLASGTTISWALEARAAYTPTSGETFTLEVEAVQG